MMNERERLATLESQTRQVNKELGDHEHRIDILEKAIVSLVHEVKLIRYALFALAGSTTPTAVKTLAGLFSGLGS